MKKKFCIVASTLLLVNTVLAAGINTDVALPVSEHHLLIRTQTRYIRATDDPSSAGRRRHLFNFPTVFIYGATAKTALMSLFPVMYRDINFGRPNQTAGIGDLTLLVRQEIFKKDWFQKTFRIALLGGLEVPSGDDPFTSSSIDFPLGLVTSLQTISQEVDLDLRYKINTEGNNLDHGDDFFYNLAYQQRILPGTLPEEGVPYQLNFVLEGNGQFTQETKNVGGAIDPNSGGHTFFISPGIQLVTKRIIAEVSFQYPVAQDLNGNQLKTTFAINGGLRAQF